MTIFINIFHQTIPSIKWKKLILVPSGIEPESRDSKSQMITTTLWNLSSDLFDILINIKLVEARFDVSKDVPPNTLVIDVPVKVIKKLN